MELGLSPNIKSSSFEWPSFKLSLHKIQKLVKFLNPPTFEASVFKCSMNDFEYVARFLELGNGKVKKFLKIDYDFRKNHPFCK